MRPTPSHFSSGTSNGHIEAAIEVPHGNNRQSSPLDWNEALDIINNATSSEQVTIYLFLLYKWLISSHSLIFKVFITITLSYWNFAWILSISSAFVQIKISQSHVKSTRDYHNPCM